MSKAVKLAPLTKLGRIVSGSTPKTNKPEFWNGNIPWVTPADLRHNGTIYFRGKTRMITEEGYKSCSAQMVPKGSILYTSRAPVGYVALASHDICTNQGFKTLVPGKELNSLYGYFALKAATPEIIHRSHGSTFGEATKEIMAEVFIPVPPLHEQERIAAILDGVHRLVQMRRYAVEETEKLLQGVFLEMFGDPVTNSKGWETVELRSVLSAIDSGSSPVCEEEPRTTEEQWAVLKLGAVTQLKFLPEENKLLPRHVKPIQGNEVRQGDVLISRKNTYDLVAACVYIAKTPPRLLLPDTIFRFNYQQALVRGQFLAGLFQARSFRHQVQKLASGTAGSMPNISKTNFGNVRIIRPGISEQDAFRNASEHWEKARNIRGEALRQSEHLFGSLLHQFFPKRDMGSN